MGALLSFSPVSAEMLTSWVDAEAQEARGRRDRTPAGRHHLWWDVCFRMHADDAGRSPTGPHVIVTGCDGRPT